MTDTIDMCSAVEFLSLTIICIVIIDGGLCHEEWKRQSDGSGFPNEPTITTASSTAVGELNTSDRVALGVGLGIGIPTLLLTCISIIAGANWCCGKRNKEDQKPPRETAEDSVPKPGGGGGGQVINIGEQKVEGAGNAGVATFNAPITHHHHHGN